MSIVLENVIPLLYINPKNTDEEPVKDELTQGMKNLLEKMRYSYENRGSTDYKRNTFHMGIGTMGVHICVCGKASENQDILLWNYPDKKFTTNTLCVHYLKYHRKEVPQKELENVKELLALVSKNPFPRSNLQYMYMGKIVRDYACRGQDSVFEVHRLPNTPEKEFEELLGEMALKKVELRMEGVDMVQFVVFDTSNPNFKLWEKLWREGREEVQKRIYGSASDFKKKGAKK